MNEDDTKQKSVRRLSLLTKMQAHGTNKFCSAVATAIGSRSPSPTHNLLIPGPPSSSVTRLIAPKARRPTSFTSNKKLTAQPANRNQPLKVKNSLPAPSSRRTSGLSRPQQQQQQQHPARSPLRKVMTKRSTTPQNAGVTAAKANPKASSPPPPPQRNAKSRLEPPKPNSRIPLRGKKNETAVSSRANAKSSLLTPHKKAAIPTPPPPAKLGRPGASPSSRLQQPSATASLRQAKRYTGFPPANAKTAASILRSQVAKSSSLSKQGYGKLGGVKSSKPGSRSLQTISEQKARASPPLAKPSISSLSAKNRAGSSFVAISPPISRAASPASAGSELSFYAATTTSTSGSESPEPAAWLKGGSIPRLSDSNSAIPDIRKHRIMLRRKRGKAGTPTSDELDGRDYSMQQASLRLLSQAIIPAQAIARRFLAIKKYHRAIWAVLVMQSVARCCLAIMMLHRSTRAVITLQAWMRSSKLRLSFELHRGASILIQRLVRGHQARLQQAGTIGRVIVVQSVVRTFLEIHRFYGKRVAANLVQSAFRSWLARIYVRRLHQAGTVIQARWRAWWTRLNYQLDLIAIIIVQSVWRRNQARRRYNGIRWASHYVAATIVQAEWRMIVQRDNFLIMKIAAIRMQSAARMFLCSKRLHKHLAARAIQTWWRCKFSLFQYVEQQLAAAVIQSHWRLSIWKRRSSAWTALYRDHVAPRRDRSRRLNLKVNSFDGLVIMDC